MHNRIDKNHHKRELINSSYDNKELEDIDFSIENFKFDDREDAELEQENLKSLNATDIYLSQVGDSPLLTKEKEIYYSRLIKKGDEAARKKMIESNLRLVVKIARRYLHSGMPILDLIEEGNLGLMRAVEKFDPELGFRFSTYGALWIQQNIERAIMSQSRTIRLPVHIVKQINKCLRTGRELTKSLDHEPTAKDIADVIDQKNINVEKMLSLNERIISIDTPISEEFNKALIDSLGSEQYSPEINCLQENLRYNISNWLSSLTSLQRAVIERRFGLNNFDITTLEKTGYEVGITREKVRQLQIESLGLLKNLIKSQGEDLNTLLN